MSATSIQEAVPYVNGPARGHAIRMWRIVESLAAISSSRSASKPGLHSALGKLCGYTQIEHAYLQALRRNLGLRGEQALQRSRRQVAGASPSNPSAAQHPPVLFNTTRQAAHDSHARGSPPGSSLEWQYQHLCHMEHRIIAGSPSRSTTRSRVFNARVMGYRDSQDC